MQKLKKIYNYYKNAKIPFIFMILNFLMFIYFWWGSVGFKCQLKILFFACVPFLSFWGIVYFKNKHRNKSYSLVTCIMIFFFIFYQPTLLGLAIIWQDENPYINEGYYKYFYRNYSDLKDVFPSFIPKNAKNVKFKYHPGFLQGGTYYILQFFRRY